MIGPGRAIAWALVLLATPAWSQSPVDAERAEFARWLARAPNSPAAALTHRAVGEGVTLGPPEADVPLPGVALHRLTLERGVVRLAGPDGDRLLARHRLQRLGPYHLQVSGDPGRAALTLFGRPSAPVEPDYFPYDPALAFSGPLLPPEREESLRILALDGVEVEATVAGMVRVPLGDPPATLRVLRVPNPATEEADLEIYFRDRTNGTETYPAGRFVKLVPLPSGDYRLDFNRARNPFCAYNSAYPCPVPWPGNLIAAPVSAGERYRGGGLEVPLPAP